MLEREPGLKSKTPKVEGREVKKEKELNEGTIKRITALLSDRQKAVKELIAFEEGEQKLSPEGRDELRDRFLYSLDKARCLIKRGTVDEKLLLSLLTLPGYRQGKLKETFRMLSESFNAGLLPKDAEFTKRLQIVKEEIGALDGEEKDIKKIIESRKTDKLELE